MPLMAESQLGTSLGPRPPPPEPSTNADAADTPTGLPSAAAASGQTGKTAAPAQAKVSAGRAKGADGETLQGRSPRLRERPRGCLEATAVLALVSAALYAAAFSAFWVLFFAGRIPLPPAHLSAASASGTVAQFNPACLSSACPVLGEGFFFGLATAPAHVEDALQDSWLDFAQYGHMVYSDSHNSSSSTAPPNETFWSSTGAAEPVKAWRNQGIPEQRLRFWTEPEVELDLAQGTGADAIRMGVDWSRLVPLQPNGTSMNVDWSAVEHYKEMLKMAKARKLRVMLTLFHHSFPKWGLETGGWTNDSAITSFLQLAELAAAEFSPWVDYWCTFNEPTIFSLLSHCLGVWPPGFRPSAMFTAHCFSPIGQFSRAMTNIARAHNAAYAVLRAKSSAPIGVAHNIGFMVPFSAMDLAAQQYYDLMTLFPWVDQVAARLDYCGLNYYSQEIVSMAGLLEVRDEEYSEAGRAVYPDGLYKILLAFHDRYKAQYPGLRFLVTENGMADATDILRGPYLVEHLLALHAAIQEGVPVDGYFHWTVSDNWEWADGYCPKFGLVAVDRNNNLTRTPRPSYHLYKQIIASRTITADMRDAQWNTLQEKAKAGVKRPFCRSVDSAGRMGSASLDEPVMRPISRKDWRFRHYEQPGLGNMYRRATRIFACWGQTLLDILA